MSPRKKLSDGVFLCPVEEKTLTFSNSLATCASRRQGSATSVVQSATSVVQSAGCAGFRRVSRAPATNSTRTAKKSGARAPLPRLTTHSLHCSKPTLPHWPPPTLSRASRAPQLTTHHCPSDTTLQPRYLPPPTALARHLDNPHISRPKTPNHCPCSPRTTKRHPRAH